MIRRGRAGGGEFMRSTVMYVGGMRHGQGREDYYHNILRVMGGFLPYKFAYSERGLLPTPPPPLPCGRASDARQAGVHTSAPTSQGDLHLFNLQTFLVERVDGA